MPVHRLKAPRHAAPATPLHGDTLGHLANLEAFVGRITQKPLLTGNAITPLVNGEAAQRVQ